MDLYQSLVTVNPVKLIGQIVNLYITLAVVKIFFLDKIKAILDQRREAADKEITDAQAAKAEALEIKQSYEQNMKEAKAQASTILERAQKTAAARGEEIIKQANDEATAIREKAAAVIAQEKKKAINDAKDEIAGISLAIAGKVVGRELTADDQKNLIDSFINDLCDQV